MIVKHIKDLKEFRMTNELKSCYRIFGELLACDERGEAWIKRNLYSIILVERKMEIGKYDTI